MTTAPPGWHPDPSNPNALRWWDGAQWTEHTQIRPNVPPAPPVQNWAVANGFVQQSFAARNKGSLTAIGVSIVYVVIAFAAHIVFFGIFPVLLTVRAFQRKEALAPAALVATAVAVVMAIVALS